MKANTKCCANEQCSVPQSIRLSQKTTAEILGGNLSVLIAIDKNGQQMRFLPYDDKNEPVPLYSNNLKAKTIKISIALQKPQNVSEKILRFVKKSARKAYIVANHCLCKSGGVEWRC